MRPEGNFFKKHSDFSLWGIINNRATTCIHIIHCTIFPFLAHYEGASEMPTQFERGVSCWNFNVLVFVSFNEFHSPLNCFSGNQYLNYWQSAYLQEKCRVFLTMASNLLMPHADNVSVYFRHGPSKAWAYIQHLRNIEKINF